MTRYFRFVFAPHSFVPQYNAGRHKFVDRAPTPTRFQITVVVSSDPDPVGLSDQLFQQVGRIGRQAHFTCIVMEVVAKRDNALGAKLRNQSGNVVQGRKTVIRGQHLACARESTRLFQVHVGHKQSVFGWPV